MTGSSDSNPTPFSWEGRKVVVTGGAGFVGSYLVEDLLRRGAKVRVADDLSSGSLENLQRVRDDVDVLQADLRTPEHARSAIPGQEAALHPASSAKRMLHTSSHNAAIPPDPTP